MSYNVTASRQQTIMELAKIVRTHCIGCNLPKECNSLCDVCCAEAIWDAGFRREATSSLSVPTPKNVDTM